MTATSHYDVGIIGAGPAGVAAALDLAAAGKSVVMIDEAPAASYATETLLQQLVAGVAAKEQVGFLAGAGLTDPGVKVDWPALVARGQRFASHQATQRLNRLTAAGVTLITGHAQFVAPLTVAVTQTEATTTITATDWIVATGASATDEGLVGDSLTLDDLLALPTLPATLVISGQGPQALTLATIVAGAGAKVHLVVPALTLAPGFDDDLLDTMLDQLDDRGVQVYFDTTIVDVTATEEGQVATLHFGNTIVADVVVALPALRGNLTALATDDNLLQRNDHLQTADPHVYAIGSVSDPTMSATKAIYEGRYVAAAILGYDQPIWYPAMPVVIDATPQIAQVGVTTQHLPADFSIRDVDMTLAASAYRLGEPAVRVKVVLNGQGIIVGAAALGMHAAELINYLTQAIQQRVSYQTIRHQFYATPTVGAELEQLF